MERKIGETFEFEGMTLQVKESAFSSCDGCFFKGRCSSSRKEVTGHCQFEFRTDDKDVIFVEITEEQPQEQAEPQKLNLCEILENCPEGKLFWSPLLGDVHLYDLDEEAKNIKVLTKGGISWNINHDGTITINGETSEEIMLYPSREQRDWTKVKYEPKKEKFDPKTLKAFDKVLTRDEHFEDWSCDIFSYISDDEPFKYITISNSWKCCIPYNDDTKHLVGTEEEAPDFYKYWED